METTPDIRNTGLCIAVYVFNKEPVFCVVQPFTNPLISKQNLTRAYHTEPIEYTTKDFILEYTLSLNASTSYSVSPEKS